MPYEVHRRFWMQPNIIISLFMGIGISHGSFHVHTLFTTTWKPTWTIHTAIKYSMALLIPFYFFNWGTRCMQLYNNLGAMAGQDGKYFQRYGMAGLASAKQPHGSLLISTTDINWNSMRYLQTCEASTPSVTHVSLQIYPFPWFKRQQHLYSNVVWPPVLSDASMSKGTEGHTKLLSRFLHSNLNQFPSGVFLDMHGISHQVLSSESTWQGLQFLPHGLLWQVQKAPLATTLNPQKYLEWQTHSALAHERTQRLVIERPRRHVMFPGSWEEAAFHISLDAVYQRALFQVSYAVSMASGWLISASKTTDEKQTYSMALQDGFLLLKDITSIVNDENITTSLNSNDVQKNFALVSARYSFLVATDTSSGTSGQGGEGGEGVGNVSSVEISTTAVLAVQSFLKNNKNNPNDAAAPAFTQILPFLLKVQTEESASPGSVNKMKKNKKKKKKSKKKKKEEKIPK